MTTRPHLDGDANPGARNGAVPGTRASRAEVSRAEQVVPHRRNGDRRRAAVRLVGGGVLLYLALAAVGLAITKLTELKFLLTEDSRIAQWFFEQRTPALNTVTHVGTMLSDTITAIALTAVLFVAFRLWLHRWHESFVLMASILGELFVFLLVTNTVDRKRPPVPHLDPAPPTSSFPSGHTAAAVALYGCLAVILVRTMVNRSLARVLAILCWCVPVVVALSRMYRGMHYLSDVTFGAIGGGLWLAIVLTTLSVNGSRDRSPAPDLAPPGR